MQEIHKEEMKATLQGYVPRLLQEKNRKVLISVIAMQGKNFLPI